MVDGLTESQDLMNTPVATEITEEFTPIYPKGEPTCPAEFFYENELLRKKISKYFQGKQMMNETIQFFYYQQMKYQRQC